MRKITCLCEQTFNADLPETVNIDENPELVTDIQQGVFLTCICPSCNADVRTELKTRINWPSKNVSIVLLPETDRFSFLSGKISPEQPDDEIVIGYPEMADRVAVYSASLEPMAVEAVKVHLATKAKESAPDADITIMFESLRDNKDLEFHIHGLKSGEVAVTLVPFNVYETILNEIHDNPASSYNELKNGQYVSVNNILIEGGQDD
ncbi:CpXC domain-containing protein [Brucepastera parasyntrophica]|uniref:CpXC domain-containing protein n=1 Tax=Brucepastera parasyntrophica TaxID=2880008 RepID=UPI00210E2E3F|nr:CpXC domain-containing protein [Brucepastera parasyntrophica]ULQ59960.1 CpXC domain-containing protein [Brucepastera parasyntrophica]